MNISTWIIWALVVDAVFCMFKRLPSNSCCARKGMRCALYPKGAAAVGEGAVGGQSRIALPHPPACRPLGELTESRTVRYGCCLSVIGAVLQLPGPVARLVRAVTGFLCSACRCILPHFVHASISWACQGYEAEMAPLYFTPMGRF